MPTESFYYPANAAEFGTYANEHGTYPLKVVLLAGYTYSSAHVDVADLTGEITTGSVTRPSLTTVAVTQDDETVQITCASPVIPSCTFTGATCAVVFSDRGADADSPLIRMLDFGGTVNNTAEAFTIALESGILVEYTPAEPEVTSVAGEEPDDTGDVPASAVAAAVAPFLDIIASTTYTADVPPTAPTVGDLWNRTAAGLVASMRYDWLADGVVPNMSMADATPPWDPTANGPGTSGAIAILDGSAYSGVSPAVLDGVMRSPTYASGDTVMIPTYVVPAPDGIRRAIIGVADWIDTGGLHIDGASINVTWVTPAGTGPIGHFALVEVSGEIVSQLKVGLDNGGTAYLGSTPVTLDRRLGAGDHVALCLDSDARAWWLEVNGVLVNGTLTVLTVDGADDDVVVDGETVTTVTGGLDFADLFAVSTPTSNSGDDVGPDGWRSGYHWFAVSEHDYDPNLIGLLRYTADGWVLDGDEPEYREATRRRLDAVEAGGGGGGSGDVVGPASVTANRVALFDGTTGKLIKQASGGYTAADIGAVPTSRTLAGLDLTADRSASALRAALDLEPGTDFSPLSWSVRVRKPSDETITNNTLQDDDHLLFAVGASETWAFSIDVFASCTDTSRDLLVEMTAPSGSTLVGAVTGPATSFAGTFPIAMQQLGVIGGGGVAAGLATAPAMIRLTGTVATGGSSGNVVLQWAQNSTGATGSKVLTGSLLTAHRIA